MSSNTVGVRSWRTRVALMALATLMCVSTGACSSTDDTSGGADTSPAATTDAAEQSGESTATPNLEEWFTGSWTVDFALVTVDPDADWSRAAAGQPTASWKCRVDGYDMVIDAGVHVYTGSLTDDGSGAWTYDGTATYLDEEGVEWTSHIIVTGVRESDDAFSAEQWGEISSDSDGTLYTATWDAVGMRIPE